MRALVALCLALSAAAPVLGAVTVELRPEAIVAGEHFRLGDIGRVSNAGEVSNAELAALRIGVSPRAGATLALQRAEVERALLQLAPRLRGGLELTGPERIVVRRGPLQSLDLAQVNEAASHELRRALAARYARFEAEPAVSDTQTHAQTALGIPAGRVELKVRLPGLAPLAARVAVWTDVYVEGRVYRSIPVSFRVQAWQPVLAARRPLAPGAPLRAADFEAREAQVAGRAAAPLPVDLDPAGLRLKRRLGAGAALTSLDVERSPGVARDQPVRVRISLGAIGLETVAVATRDAAAGEVLRVRNAGNNQTYPARVVEAGIVEALWR